MSLVDDIIRSAAPPAILAAFGDPVTLPDGRVVSGVFDRYGASASAPWDDTGSAVPLALQPAPSVELRDADAATLEVNSPLLIGGALYLVAAAPRVTGTGLTRVDLMLSEDEPSAARWQ